jgi:hypothetical protein
MSQRSKVFSSKPHSARLYIVAFIINSEGDLYVLLLFLPDWRNIDYMSSLLLLNFDLFTLHELVKNGQPVQMAFEIHCSLLCNPVFCTLNNSDMSDCIHFSSVEQISVISSVIPGKDRIIPRSRLHPFPPTVCSSSLYIMIFSFHLMLALGQCCRVHSITMVHCHQ